MASASAPRFSQRRAPAAQSAAQGRAVAAQRGAEIPVFADPVPVRFDAISSLSVASLDYTLLVRATKTHGVWKTKNGAHIRAIEVEDVTSKVTLKEFGAVPRLLKGCAEGDLLIVQNFEVQEYEGELNLLPSVGSVLAKLPPNAIVPSSVTPPQLDIQLSTVRDIQGEPNALHSFAGTIRVAGTPITEKRASLDVMVEVESGDRRPPQGIRLRLWDEMVSTFQGLGCKKGSSILVLDGKSWGGGIQAWPGTARIRVLPSDAPLPSPAPPASQARAAAQTPGGQGGPSRPGAPPATEPAAAGEASGGLAAPQLADSALGADPAAAAIEQQLAAAQHRMASTRDPAELQELVVQVGGLLQDLDRLKEQGVNGAEGSGAPPPEEAKVGDAAGPGAGATEEVARSTPAEPAGEGGPAAEPVDDSGKKPEDKGDDDDDGSPNKRRKVDE